MSPAPSHVLALAAAVVVAACAGGARLETQPSPASASPHGSVPAGVAEARADSARYPWTAADVRFMTGMIGHHAQAIRMARMAPTHGASPQVQTLAARIINAQRDEIATMQTWLRDRLQPVPQVDSTGMLVGSGHDMHAMHDMHDMSGELMPGMLTPEQMQELDASRGAAFDERFLTYMIQHHRGAVAMVEELFGSYGAAQDERVFKLATDVNVDQLTEIARMEKMLVALVLGGPGDAP